MGQRTMPMMGEARKTKPASDELVRMCRNELDAVRLCVQLSGMTHEYISESLDIDKGHWSRIMQGQAHFPTFKRLALMELCGNYAPVQFEAWKCGFDLVEQSKDARVRELEAELAQLRAAG